MKQAEISLNTKRKLAECLKSKMKEKSFAKITVSELVKETNINRKTFYYHFDDIYSLFKWMLEEEAINIVRHFDLLVDSEEAIIFVMNYVEENEHIINCAFDSMGRDALHRFFFSDFNDIVASLIQTEEKKNNLKLDPTYKEFLVHFYTSAIGGILIDWMENREHLDRKTTIDNLTNTMKWSLESVFKSQSEL